MNETNENEKPCILLQLLNSLLGFVRYFSVYLYLSDMCLYGIYDKQFVILSVFNKNACKNSKTCVVPGYD